MIQKREEEEESGVALYSRTINQTKCVYVMWKRQFGKNKIELFSPQKKRELDIALLSFFFCVAPHNKEVVLSQCTM
jgi:hypothetical protein